MTCEAKRIPITAARRIAEEYGYEQVIIYARCPTNGKEHVTTYGVSKAMCNAAAKIGEWFKRQWALEKKAK